LNTKITASLYAAALVFAGDRDVRFYLNGVRVEPAPNGIGTLVVATDGHRLVVMHDEAGSVAGEGVILPRIKVAARDAKAGSGSLEFDAGRVTLPSGASLPAAYMDGRYPDWRAIVPDWSVAGQAGWINPDYLGDFAAIPKAYGVRYTSIGMNARDAECAVLVRVEGCPAFGVVMPLRACRDKAGKEIPRPMGEPEFLARPKAVAGPALASVETVGGESPVRLSSPVAVY
jgi:hypothetical protein